MEWWPQLISTVAGGLLTALGAFFGHIYLSRQQRRLQYHPLEVAACDVLIELLRDEMEDQQGHRLRRRQAGLTEEEIALEALMNRQREVLIRQQAMRLLDPNLRKACYDFTRVYFDLGEDLEEVVHSLTEACGAAIRHESPARYLKTAQVRIKRVYQDWEGQIAAQAEWEKLTGDGSK